MPGGGPSTGDGTLSAAQGNSVGLFGGSFNPPHICHLLASLYLLETTEMQSIWWLPVHRHAFEKDRDLASWEHRVAMCEAVVSEHPNLHVNRVEEELGEKSWTIDTITALRRQHPGVEFSWVIGSDLLAELPLWSRWEELRTMVRFVVLGRGEERETQLPAGGSFLVRDFHLPDISSTTVRDLLRAGRSAAHLVPAATASYLGEHPELYR